MQREELHDHYIKNLSSAEARYEIYDEEIKNLAIRIGARRKTFVLVTRFSATPDHLGGLAQAHGGIRDEPCRVASGRIRRPRVSSLSPNAYTPFVFAVSCVIAAIVAEQVI